MFLRRSFSNILKDTALKVIGLTEKWNPSSVIGITNTETVKLDFDDASFKTVRYWAKRAMRWFKLGGFLILKSSANHYHVVFNRCVSWSENMHVLAWVSLLSHNKKAQRYTLMQCIKEASTLRVSPKKQKPSPRIVYRYGKQDEQISSFLHYRKLIKRILYKSRAYFKRSTSESLTRVKR